MSICVSCSLPFRAAYHNRIASGDVRADPAQERAVELLQVFADQVKGYAVLPQPKAQNLLSRLGGILKAKPPAPQHTAGLYIHGKVGRGKSMLMDLFYDHVEIAQKRRVHFHQFMLEIHARLNHLRQDSDITDIMRSLVREIAAETSLLCFDEFHVSNIADAMILGRLFSGLFDAGVLIVLTSNSAPDTLYKNGLQRDRFLPFIDLIKKKMRVYEMDGGTDYRYEQLRHLDTVFYPLNDETTRKLQGLFYELTHEAEPELMRLQVNGRELRLSQATHGIGFFNFDELCGTALGSADYLAIAECLHTVIMDGVPLLRAEARNEALRFMTFIDTLYEAKVKIFLGTAAPIDQLAPSGELADAFQRTTSRLMEMQGEAYRLKPHLG